MTYLTPLGTDRDVAPPPPPGPAEAPTADPLPPAALAYLARIRAQLLAEEQAYGLAIGTLALGREYARGYRRLVAVLCGPAAGDA